MDFVLSKHRFESTFLFAVPFSLQAIPLQQCPCINEHNFSCYGHHNNTSYINISKCNEKLYSDYILQITLEVDNY